MDARPPMQSTLLVPPLAESRDENPLLETSAYGRINFRSDGKSAYEPPVSISISFHSVKDPGFISFCCLLTTGPLCHRCAPTCLKTESKLGHLFQPRS